VEVLAAVLNHTPTIPLYPVKVKEWQSSRNYASRNYASRNYASRNYASRNYGCAAQIDGVVSSIVARKS
jgi:hypothetical protein